ncbi:unnamed protein product [Natator depressus]
MPAKVPLKGSKQNLPAVPEGHELFSTSGDPKEQPLILGTSALVEDSAVPRRALLKGAHHQEKAKRLQPPVAPPRVSWGSLKCPSVAVQPGCPVHL